MVHLFGNISPEHPEQWTAFIAIIQLGTLFAVVVYFWKEILNIIQSFFRDNLLKPKKIKKQSYESLLGWYIIAGTIPIVLIGLILKPVIEGHLTKNLFLIGGSLIFFALLLAWAEYVGKQKRDMKKLTLMDGLAVGLGQVFALLPGASRSGTTITAGLLIGLKRETAAHFSFLLSLPAIFASAGLELKESLNFFTHELLTSYIVGILFSFLSGYIAIDFLLKFLKTKSTSVFIWYRIFLGAGIIIFSIARF